MIIPEQFERWCKEQQIDNPFCARAKLYLNVLINEATMDAFKQGMRHQLHVMQKEMKEMIGDTQ